MHQLPKNRNTVVILGGKGGLEARYRRLLANHGYELRHFERRVPSRTLPAAHKIALVIVMISMVSHPLLAHARQIAAGGAELVYLERPSLSAVQRTMAERLL